jgi:hypothetical protein
MQKNGNIQPYTNPNNTNPVHVGRVKTRGCEVKYINALKIIYYHSCCIAVRDGNLTKSEGFMIRNIKTGASLIVIGLFTLITTFSATEGSVFFFTTLISMVLVLLGCLQFWIDREDFVENENRYANKNIN